MKKHVHARVMACVSVLMAGLCVVCAWVFSGFADWALVAGLLVFAVIIGRGSDTFLLLSELSRLISEMREKKDGDSEEV